ncbi:MAG: thiamine diphosphokinase [Desulfotignum sp.]|jgi:thiamine pyrophosphokinase|nr:thiamine diphosphokinase [Desulfotignum sp.]
MKCIIIAGGSLYTGGSLSDSSRPQETGRKARWEQRLEHLLSTADLIIAADSGATHLMELNRLPHIIIGDLDSIAPRALHFFKKKGVDIRTHPTRKNQTDTQLCLAHALDQGADDITLLAATGTRLDHTLANIFMLTHLTDAGVQARILDPHNEICLVKDRLELSGNPGDLLSLIPVSPRVEGVTLQGLAFPLENHTLYLGSSLGISNYFMEKKTVISIRSGILIAARSTD